MRHFSVAPESTHHELLDEKLFSLLDAKPFVHWLLLEFSTSYSLFILLLVREQPGETCLFTGVYTPMTTTTNNFLCQYAAGNHGG